MPHHRMKTVACAYLMCAAALLVGVQGHGYMLQPPSRNYLGSPAGGRTEAQGVLTYTPHGGNGKGVCGDNFEGGGGPFSNLAFGQLRAPTRYSPGQRITLKVYINAAHGGTYAFQLCDRTSGLDHACFNRWLTRADTGERYWYIFDRGQNQEYSFDFVLPSDFSCPNGCVLRWEYYTGNSCVMRQTIAGCTSCGGYANGGVYGVGTSPGLCPVGATLQSGPEVFYNCADVIISGTTPPGGCSPSCPAPNACQTGGGCNAATRTCNPFTNVANGSPCTGGTCQNGVCQPSTCPTTCPTPSNTQCQKGGGCNTATRTCNPITNVANGSPCTGGTCQNGACQQSTQCPTTCPTPSNTCQSGGGCNTATRTCNSITNVANGSPCTGGTCQSGVCQPSGGPVDPCPGTTPGQARATCFCTRPGRALGRYQDTTYACSGGFWCYSGGAQYIQCGPNTRYDPPIGVCNHAAAVPCDGRMGPASVGLRGARPGAMTQAVNASSTDSGLEQQPGASNTGVVDPHAVVAAVVTESAQAASSAAVTASTPSQPQVTAEASAPVATAPVVAHSLEPAAAALTAHAASAVVPPQQASAVASTASGTPGVVEPAAAAAVQVASVAAAAP